MDLAIIIPVYNEESTIKELIQDLDAILLANHISYTFFIINDGSTDRSESIIKSLIPLVTDLQLISGPNKGHGPSLLKGYHLAHNYSWVLQLDSDYQYHLAAFIKLWENRNSYDLLLAERATRSASVFRNAITSFLSHLFSLIYGRGIKDVNTPYRLMRVAKLNEALRLIGHHCFAPNTLISAFFIKKQYPVFTTGCQLRTNAVIKKSRLTTYIFKGCVQSIFDLVFFRFKL